MEHKQFKLVVGKDGGEMAIHLEVDQGRLHTRGYSGDVLAEFSSQQWQDECNRVASLVGKTPEEVSSAAFEGYIMAMDDAAFGIQDEVPEPPMPERLQIYVAIARITYLLCQGIRLTTREAARKMTRSRVTAWRILRDLEAGGFFPIRLVHEDGIRWYWEMSASRHLRI